MFIPTEQYGVIKDAMPMVSLPIEVTASIPNNTTTPVGLASFINLGAVIQYNVYTSDSVYGAEEIQSVTFIATSPIAGNFDVDLTAVSETSIPSPNFYTYSSYDTVTSFLDTPDVAGIDRANGLKVFQVVAPGTLSGTVTVTTDAATYSYPVANVSFDRAKIKTLNVDLASTNATRRTLADYETLLTAHEWQLVSVVDYDGNDVTENAGDALTFNADYSLTLTCNTQADEVYDYMNGGWVDYGLGYEWDYWTREWSFTGFYGAWAILHFTDYAYPLAVVTDNTNSQDYYIVSLTDAELVLQWGMLGDYTITFTNPAGPAPTPATPEELLTAHEWELCTVTLNGGSVYPDVSGNKMTLNADHSFSFDCSANGGYTADYVYGSVTTPDFSYSWATYEWSLSLGADNYLVFTKMSYPLVIVDDYYNAALSYKIATLTENTLVLEYNHSTDGLYTITFANPAAKSLVESLLTANDWVLTDVTRDGVDVTQTDGNIMMLNTNHSVSYDISSNNDWNDHVYDYIEDAYTNPSYYSPSTWEWSVSFGTVTSLVLSKRCFPLVIVGDFQNYALPYEIVTLTDSDLVLEYNNTTCGDDSVHGLYRISFTAQP